MISQRVLSATVGVPPSKAVQSAFAHVWKIVPRPVPISLQPDEVI
jgi:hypothetical protein